jgi:hypothetical protein
VNKVNDAIRVLRPVDLPMTGCIDCAVPFPRLPPSTNKCARCIKIEQCGDDEDKIAAIQRWKQCGRCGHSSLAMIMNVNRCTFCASSSPERRQKQPVVIDLSSTPDKMEQKYEEQMQTKRAQVKTSDIRYKGEKQEKVALFAGKNAFGNHNAIIPVKSEGQKSHKELEADARQKAANHKAGINVVIELSYSKNYSLGGRKGASWSGIGNSFFTMRSIAFIDTSLKLKSSMHLLLE